MFEMLDLYYVFIVYFLLHTLFWWDMFLKVYICKIFMNLIKNLQEIKRFIIIISVISVTLLILSVHLNSQRISNSQKLDVEKISNYF